MKLNDKIQTLKKSRWWDKGDVGRIVHKTYDSYDRVVYLVCFDSTCHKMHDHNGGHVWYYSFDAWNTSVICIWNLACNLSAN